MYTTYYVDVSNSFNPHLSATALSPTYVMDSGVSITTTNQTMIGSNVVYFPPFEYVYINTSIIGLQHREIGLTENDCLNWHQFLAHMRFKRFDWKTPITMSDFRNQHVGLSAVPTTIIYKLKGERILIDAEEHYVGNSTIGYDIQMGFDTGVNIIANKPYCFSYKLPPHQISMVGGSDDVGEHDIPLEHGATLPSAFGPSMYGMLITNQGSDPYKLNFKNLNGNSLRFLAGTHINLYFMNGMIQTSEGVSLNENSDIVFERMFVNKFSGEWNSLNDIFYGVNGKNIKNYYWTDDVYLSSLMLNQFYYVGNNNSSYGYNVTLDNMWINASGYIGNILNRNFNVYNSTLRADYTLLTFKQYDCDINIVNSLVVTRDNAFENIGDPSTQKKPLQIFNCTVCWGNMIAADPTKSFVLNSDNIQYNYKRGVFVSDIQDYPPDMPPPRSIMTSAVELITKDRLSYFHPDFSGISISVKNSNQTSTNILTGLPWANGTYVQSRPDYLTLEYNTGHPGLGVDHVVEYSNVAIGVSVYGWVQGLQNVWWDVDADGIIGNSTVVRDGIGALYFDTFNNKSYNWISDETNVSPGDSVSFDIIDGDVTDFVNVYNPLEYVWNFSDTTKNIITTATSVSHEFQYSGVYDVGVDVKSYHGFYYVTDKKNSVIRVTSVPLFDFVVVNMDGSTPTNYYAGRQYLLSATNITDVGVYSITDIEYKYGENLDGDLFYNNSFTTPVDLTLMESERYPSCMRKRVVFNANSNTFAFGGNKYTTPIVFPHPIGWSNFAMAAHSIDGSYALLTKQYFIEIKEDVYYVDLSIEYENQDHWLTNTTGFIDTFENGVFNPGWSTNFSNGMTIVDMWGDKSATQIVGSQTIKMFDEVISSDFDVEFSLVRTDPNTSPMVSFVCSNNTMSIVWDYKNSSIRITGTRVDDANTVIQYIKHGFAYDLRCDNSLKSVVFKVNGTSKTIMYKFNNEGEWIDSGYITQQMGSISAINCMLGSYIGIGYFMGTASSGFFITNGTTEDYPLTFTQFATRVNSTALAYDKYLCKNYRKLLPTQNLNVIVPVTITHWLSSTMIGPWVLQFEKRTSPKITTSLELAMLKNGVIYNSDSTGVLKIGKTYDMYIVWNGTQKLIQIPEKWKASKYSVSNVIGSTIKMAK